MRRPVLLSGPDQRSPSCTEQMVPLTRIFGLREIQHKETYMKMKRAFKHD